MMWCLFSAYSHSDADVLNQSLLEANIATEVCLTVLDTLSIFIMGFKVTFCYKNNTYVITELFCGYPAYEGLSPPAGSVLTRPFAPSPFLSPHFTLELSFQWRRNAQKIQYLSYVMIISRQINMNYPPLVSKWDSVFKRMLSVSSDSAVLGPRPQSTDEEGVWGPPLFPANQPVRDGPQAGLHLPAHLHLQGETHLWFLI